MRFHGVPLWPDPESSGAFDKSKLTPHQLGVSSLQIVTAEKACRSLAPTYSATEQWFGTAMHVRPPPEHVSGTVESAGV